MSENRDLFHIANTHIKKTSLSLQDWHNISPVVLLQLCCYPAN